MAYAGAEGFKLVEGNRVYRVYLHPLLRHLLAVAPVAEVHRSTNYMPTKPLHSLHFNLSLKPEIKIRNPKPKNTAPSGAARASDSAITHCVLGFEDSLVLIFDVHNAASALYATDNSPGGLRCIIGKESNRTSLHLLVLRPCFSNNWYRGSSGSTRSGSREGRLALLQKAGDIQNQTVAESVAYSQEAVMECGLADLHTARDMDTAANIYMQACICGRKTCSNPNSRSLSW